MSSLGSSPMRPRLNTSTSTEHGSSSMLQEHHMVLAQASSRQKTITTIAGVPSVCRSLGKWPTMASPSIPTWGIRSKTMLQTQTWVGPNTVLPTTTQRASIAAPSPSLSHGMISACLSTSTAFTALPWYGSTANTWATHKAPTPTPSSTSQALLPLATTNSLYASIVGATGATSKVRTCGTSRASIATYISWPRRRCLYPTTTSPHRSTPQPQAAACQ